MNGSPKEKKRFDYIQLVHLMAKDIIVFIYNISHSNTTLVNFQRCFTKSITKKPKQDIFTPTRGC